ncbi:MAG: histidine--tRNA ligase [Acidimicrobiales bacterium]
MVGTSIRTPAQHERGSSVAKLDNGPARGTRDFPPAAVARREAVISAIADSYESFGYRRIETPAIESVERLTGGEGGENEKLVYKILKRGLPQQLPPGTELSDLTDLALRFDLTVPLTRFFANNHSQLPTPFRSLQIGSVWRAERPGKGRYRQFTQCDIDVIGEPTVLAEAELLEATVAALLSLFIEPITVRLNDRRLLSAVATAAGVDSGATAGYFVTLDKLDKIGWDGVASELAERGLDAGVAASTEELIEYLTDSSSDTALLDRLGDALPQIGDDVIGALRETESGLERLSREYEGMSFVVDPTVVRGMGYYTGQIFEISHPSAASSIAGGGRYDGLVGRSLGREVAACGISIGFERVVDLARIEPPDLGVAVLYDDEPFEDVLAAARAIRKPGSRAALVPRRKATHQQLASLQAEGYRAFVTFDNGKPSDPRPLGPESS